MRSFLLLLLIMMGLGFARAQSEENFRLWAADIIENMAASSEDELDYSILIDDLMHLYYQPLNINTAQREDLQRIFFLSDAHIEALLFQRYQVGAYWSVYELQAVEGFNRQIIEWLDPLIVFEEGHSGQVRKFRPKGDLFLRTQWTIETPRGYKGTEDNPPPFKGDKMKYYSRLEWQPLRTLEFGVVTEKDAGEPMFDSNISTMDFFSGYVSWKPERFLQQIIVGQFRISSGQGLALQTGMAPRKSNMTTSIRNRNANHRPSLSVNESGGLSGVLVSIGSSVFRVTPFVSVKQIDGRLSETETGEIIISSLKTDGYHRTPTELSQRRNVQEVTAGIVGKVHVGRLIMEAGHLEYRLEFPLQPEPRPYNIYYFRGDQMRNSWVACQGSLSNVFLFSEMALNTSSTPAVTGGALFSAGGGAANMSLSYRYFPVDYFAPFGAPFSESGNAAGESGVYAGLELALPAGFLLNAYLDYFQHEWLKYQTRAPSNGYDFLGLLTYRPKRTWESSLRYRYKEKTVNLSTVTPDFPVGVQKQNQVRFQTRLSPDASWAFTTRVDYHFVDSPDKLDAEPGFYLAQDIRYRSPGGKWNIITRYALMDVDEYENRIYAYEPDVLYSFSTPAYYGRGSRWIVMGKWTLMRKTDLWLRFAQWHYTNRETIGSGNMTINSNVARECRIQIRKRF